MEQYSRETAVFQNFETSVGPFGVLIQSSNGQIAASGFTSNSEDLTEIVPVLTITHSYTEEALKTSNEIEKFLGSYFAGKASNPCSMFYLKSGATVFQEAVWDEICKIPFASTRSYKEIAVSVGKANSYRAAGNACGANRFALLIPCHRVVASSGATGHYRWGSELKTRLLSHETSSAS